jgi:hypothetical protein
MEFDCSPQKAGSSSVLSNRRLRVVDVFIDVKISIEKIENGFMLSEDGGIYQICLPKQLSNLCTQ